MRSIRDPSGFFICWAALTALTLLVTGCGESNPEREYTLQGQVLSVTADRNEATIKHEEIKGLMAAMTMPYQIRDAKEYAGLEPGDLITSTLVITGNGAYLKSIKKVGDAPLERSSTNALAAPASSGFELLKPGETVPDAAFVDQDGKPRDFASFRGSTVLVTFIYTKCPMPTFCPLMDRHFAAVQAKVKSDPALKRVHLVSISFDPIIDTPQVLKSHAATLGADLSRWTFLTGDRDDIDRFAARFGIAITRETDDPTNITHNLRTAIVDTRGALIKAYTGNDWTPEQAIADLSAVAGTN
jgi:protein SCO1/2